jgi:hypothetical protein
MGKRLINVDEVEEIVPVLVGKLLENNLITEEQADQIICAIFNDNDRLNEIRELNPDYDISMHKLNVCVGDSQYRLVYCIYVEHKESGISVYRDKDFDVQEVINRLPSKFTIEKEQELLPKGVNIKIHKYSINCAVSLFSNAADYFKDHTVNITISYPLKNPYTFTAKCRNLNDLINEITLAYKRIYKEEKENPGKYGIWGRKRY